MDVRGVAMRLFGGLGVVAGVLVVAFALLPGWTHYWGATDEEIRRAMPGDKILPNPIVLWTHGTTIDAPPEAVWPWIAQIGDERGGFYSYTAIENAMAGAETYHNANRIIDEFQQPRPGDSLIGGALVVRDSSPDEWLLGESPDEPAWTWIWALYPAEGGRTRLVIRNRIQPPSADMPAVAVLFMDLGGFVMEKRMMQGIVDRAEGRIDLPYQEQIELGLWLSALVMGLAAGVLFLVRRNWRRPLAAGTAAIMVLLVLVFVQPGVWIGLLLDAGLLAGLFSALHQGATAPARMTLSNVSGS